jgi:hypothetical protein
MHREFSVEYVRQELHAAKKKQVRMCKLSISVPVYLLGSIVSFVVKEGLILLGIFICSSKAKNRHRHKTIACWSETSLVKRFV